MKRDGKRPLSAAGSAMFLNGPVGSWPPAQWGDHRELRCQTAETQSNSRAGRAAGVRPSEDDEDPLCDRLIGRVSRRSRSGGRVLFTLVPPFPRPFFLANARRIIRRRALSSPSDASSKSLTVSKQVQPSDGEPFTRRDRLTMHDDGIS